MAAAAAPLHLPEIQRAPNPRGGLPANFSPAPPFAAGAGGRTHGSHPRHWPDNTRWCAAVGPLPKAQPPPLPCPQWRQRPGDKGLCATLPARSPSRTRVPDGHMDPHDHQPRRIVRAAAGTMPSGSPEQKSLAGLTRFEECLGRAIGSLEADGLHERWETAAGLLDRVVALGHQWGDAQCTKVDAEVSRLLDPARAGAKRQLSAPGEESCGPATGVVGASCAALCHLLDALCAGAPGLKRAVRRTLSCVLAAVFVTPPPLAGEDSRTLLGEAGAERGYRDFFEIFASGGLWCQRGSAASHGAEGSPSVGLSTPNADYLQRSGAAMLLNEAAQAAAKTEPHNVCTFLARWFDTRRKAARVPLADSRIVIPDGTLYLSREMAEQPAQLRHRATEQLMPTLSAASQFSSWANKQPSGVKFYANSMHRLEMYPTPKRLAFTFLHLLGRAPPSARYSTASWDRDPSGDLLFHAPHVGICTPTSTWKDSEEEIVINASVVDQVAFQCKHFDTLYNAMNTEGTPPPSAEQIYGDREFRIALRELFELERSTRVSVSGPLTARFLCELARFTAEPSQAWFFSLFRSVPLCRVGDDDALSTLRALFSDRLDAQLLEVSQAEDAQQRVLRAYEASTGAERVRILPRLAARDQELHQHRLWRDAARTSLEHLQRADVGHIAARFQRWLQGVLKTPRDYGFESREMACETADLSLAELATNVCLSQSGYFFVDGSGGGANLICPKPPQPLIFLSATGIDFNTSSTTVLEAQKYFHPVLVPGADPGAPPSAWKGFLPGAEYALAARVKQTYISIFAACQLHGVRNPSMLGMGLGAFLLNVHASDRPKVREIYFMAQLELLSERDWGFENYFLNPSGCEQAAREVLEAGIRGGRFNDPHRGRFLRCAVVIHGRDAKFLAVELAKRRMSAAVLNPSDCATLTQGAVGNRWETGRCGYFGGEEDFAATGTALLAHSGISRTLHTLGRIQHVDAGVQQLALSKYQDDLPVSRTATGPHSRLAPAPPPAGVLSQARPPSLREVLPMLRSKQLVGRRK
eukprot:TRINITY_DN9611_c0_g1_i1.p1 TRINITY_DN9611_c0_g1~~TRINITY_DN9611_c0_g1_i1.p1  ORF type:complete len:1039 (+),score=262.29 TRINITY_DN9611_c0_g1_i1:83-3199(+)